jgi:hypothetical protein
LNKRFNSVKYSALFKKGHKSRPNK